MKQSTFLAAFALDWLLGDPEALPHPVRLIGKAIDRGERALRRPEQCPRQTPTDELTRGTLLTFTIVAGTYVTTSATLRAAYALAPPLGLAVETLLGATCLASRNLHDEASAVTAALHADDIPHARTRIARIVGRDTHLLDAPGISRAVIETVAESASDGVIAPMFYMALGGVPLAMAYKAINTLDSMIGHADRRYFYFGKTAARLDDAANYLPARLTALAIIASAALLPGACPAAASNIWLRDSARHRSPNAGQPESAMAGALGVCLGGPSTYAGIPHNAQCMGEEFAPPTPRKADRAIAIAGLVSLLGAITAIAILPRLRTSNPAAEPS